MLVACTKDDVTTTASFEELKATQPTPVAFSTYLGDQAVTRAGATGAMTTETLKTNGFGVFAYHTVAAYNSSTAPNFMYNQQVSYNSTSSAWTYTPVKYWPNDFANGNVDNSSAQGTGTNGFLSFFAYAPYVATSSLTSETIGITAISTNTATSDPTLTFAKGNNPEVDLLWGTAGDNSYQNAANGTVTPKKYPDDVTGKAAVNVDLTKQTTGGNVNFAFKHALAKLGNITVDAFADAVNDGSTNSQAIANTTKITVTSVTVSTTAMPTSGTLNLATGLWTLNASPTGSLNYTFSGDGLNSTIKEPAAPVAPATLAWTDIPDGVPAAVSSYTPANLAASFPLITFFPGQRPTITVSIVYTVRTEDTALAKRYSEVVQTISKAFQFPSGFAMNTQYNLAIHLGLTSVNFTASASPWDSETAQAVDLPINVASN